MESSFGVPPIPSGRRPVFIDRDGVMNVDISPYVTHVELLEIFPYTVEALKLLHESGHDIFVISNQQGVAKGLTPPQELEKINEEFQSRLRPHGFEIKKFYYCTALKSENHPWRKPAPGMIHAACEEFGHSVEGSFFIGDKWSDIECGVNAGCRPVLVLSGVTGAEEWKEWRVQPELVFGDLLEAARFISGGVSELLARAGLS